jgi:hypothetical protein
MNLTSALIPHQHNHRPNDPNNVMATETVITAISWFITTSWVKTLDGEVKTQIPSYLDLTRESERWAVC